MDNLPRRKVVSTWLLVSVGLVSLFVGIPLSVMWLLNMGPVQLIHICGPVLVGVAWWCAVAVWDLVFPEK